MRYPFKVHLELLPGMLEDDFLKVEQTYPALPEGMGKAHPGGLCREQQAGCWDGALEPWE
jgi:hypothetical protein